MSDCLQYYYENPEDAEKYKIDCSNKRYTNLESVESFNNKELLDYFKKVNFTTNDLDGEKTIRLNKLKKLRKENIIDTKFYFNENL